MIYHLLRLTVNVAMTIVSHVALQFQRYDHSSSTSGDDAMDNNKNAQMELSPRLAYCTPQLLAYGAVRDLTTGGSSGANELAMMTAPMKKL